MKEVKGIIFLILLSNYCFSQTIINAERLSNGIDSTIYALSFSYNGTRGNSTIDQLNISPTILLLTKKNEFKLFGSYYLLSESDNKILKGGYIHLRHNFKLSKQIKTFEFYQLQFNEVLLLNKREVFGAGLRFALVNKDSLKLNFSTGVMRELEVLNKTNLLPNELSKTTYYRATNVLSFKLMAGKVIKFDNVLYYQPFLKEFADYRILNDFVLTISLSNHFGLIISVTTRFDSKPPGSLEKLDNFMSFGFNLKF